MRTLIEMAHEVYGEHTFWTEVQLLQLKELERLVRADERADEREACAKVCDDAFSSSHAGRIVCDNLAYAIRARGNT
jgi:hypothetical protein